MFLLDAVDSDAALALTQQYTVNPEGLYWIPLSVLVARGAFLRFQDWREELVPVVSPGALCMFISHRWLAPDKPEKASRRQRLYESGGKSEAPVETLCEGCLVVRVRQCTDTWIVVRYPPR